MMPYRLKICFKDPQSPRSGSQTGNSPVPLQAHGKGFCEFEVNRLGKLATWFLYASLALVMVVHGTWPRWLFWAGFVLAVISLCQYFVKARKEIRVGQGRDNLSS